MVGVLSGWRWWALVKTAAARELIGRGIGRRISRGGERLTGRACRAGATSVTPRSALLAGGSPLGDAGSRTPPQGAPMTTTPMVAPTFSDDELARLLAT